MTMHNDTNLIHVRKFDHPSAAEIAANRILKRNWKRRAIRLGEWVSTFVFKGKTRLNWPV